MQITVETLVKASTATAWNVYTTPADINQWNTASEDWHTTHSTVDLRVGRAFSSRMAAKDGSHSFDFAGTYTRVVPHQTIEYLLGNRVGRVEFSAHDQGVKVQVTFDAETDFPVEQQRQGWQAILDNFARHAEAAHARLQSTHATATATLTPYLSFDGNTREAFAFYAQALGATIGAMLRYADMPAAAAGDTVCDTGAPAAGDGIMHGQLTLPGGAQLFAGDCPPGVAFESMRGMMLALEYATVDAAAKAFAALAEGGTITMPLAPTFWAQAFGMVTDRFGVSWAVNGAPQPMH